jgi:hypothetical protein
MIALYNYLELFISSLQTSLFQLDFLL